MEKGVIDIWKETLAVTSVASQCVHNGNQRMYTQV